MELIRRMVVAGLAAMGVVAVATAIWPGFAAMVFGVFTVVLALALLAPTLVGAQWVRTELVGRRELRAMATVEAPWAVSPEPIVPTLAQLRETA